MLEIRWSEALFKICLLLVMVVWNDGMISLLLKEVGSVCTYYNVIEGSSLVGSTLKDLPAVQGTWVQNAGSEGPWRRNSNLLQYSWAEIWTEGMVRHQSRVSERVTWQTVKTQTHTHMHMHVHIHYPLLHTCTWSITNSNAGVKNTQWIAK